MRLKTMIFIILLGILASGCTLKTHEITLVINGVTANIYEVQEGTVQVNQLTLPDAPSGYQFDGWYADVSYQELVSELTLSEDKTLYGRWVLLPELEALEGLSVPTLITEAIDLPESVGEYSLTWSSSNPEYLSHDGVYLNTTLEDHDVMLTATIDDTNFTKNFQVMVKAYPIATFMAEIFDGITFPIIESDVTIMTSLTTVNGIQVTWSSSNLDVITNEGQFIQTENAEEVTISCTLSYLGYEETRTYIATTKAKVLTVQDAGYFSSRVLALGKQEEEVIMTPSQIVSFNESVLATPKTNTLRLQDVSETIDKTSLTALINVYQLMDKYTVYNASGSQPLTSTDKNVILANRNLSGITETTTIHYAISTQHTNVRSYPTYHYSSSMAIDRFQETGFGAGVPMIVYHTSLDQEWYFIRMFNYAGWVNKQEVALCDRATFLEFVNPSSFLIITSPYILVGDAHVRMGTRLPLDQGTQVRFPTRLANGTLAIELVELPEYSYHVGYLSYTYRLLFAQAYKLLGSPYSWGDKNPIGFDCSSTQAAIYNCFGFQLGRNTSNHWATSTYGKTLETVSISSISSLMPGTLLYTSSHVLMLLGVDEDGVAWLLHNTTSGNICKLQSLPSYGVSSIRYILELHPQS